MAQFVAKTCYLSVNSVDLSDHVTSATLTWNGELLDATAMGSTTTTRSFLGGLLNWQLEVEFQQDYAASKVDATLYGLIGTSTTVEFRPATGGRSATNPGYNGTAFLESYPVVSNTVGEVAKTRVVFRGSGTLTRSVA